MSADATTLPLTGGPLRGESRRRRIPAIGAPALEPSLLAHVALGTIVLAGSLIVIAAAGQPSFLAPTSRPSPPYFPGWMAGPFGGLWPGAADAPALKGLFSVAMVAAYGAYLVLVRHAGRVRLRWLLGAIAFVHLMVLLAPPLALTDVFNYLNYARMEVVHHLNPYATMPVLEPHSDPAYPLSNWHGLLSPYGPLFTLLTFAFTSLSVAAYLWTFKGVLLLADLGILVLIWRCARLLGRDPVPALVLVALNPIVLVWGLGADHNDFLTVFVVLLAVWCLLRAPAVARQRELPRLVPHRPRVREVSGWLRLPRARSLSAPRGRSLRAWLLAHGALDAAAGAALVVATGFKASAGVLIPLVLASLAGNRRRMLAALCGVILAGGAAAIATVAAFGLHFPDLSVQGSLVTGLSVPNVVGLLLGQGGETAPLHTLMNVVLAGAIAASCALAWRRREPLTAAGWATIAVIATLSWVLPWYVLWVLPFAGLAGSRRLRVATLVLGAYLTLTWIPVSNEALSGLGIYPGGTAVGRLHARAVQELLF
jgi:hypothetical protein